MTEIILGPIVGGLAPTSANIWARTDGPATLHLWMGEKADLSDGQHTGSSLPLTKETGFAGVVPVADLNPKQSYHYTLTLDSSPPATDKIYPSFTTFPPEGEQRSFSFAFGSCFWPCEEQPGKIFNQLNSLRQSSADLPNRALRFMLLLGDQIYADGSEHNGLGRVACTLDEYHQVYAHTWSQRPFRQLLADLPAFMTLDDHEVDDDWTWSDFNRERAQIPIWNRIRRRWQGLPTATQCLTRERIQAALQAYWEHQGMHARGYINFPQLNDEGRYALTKDDRGSLAYTFNYGAAAFFMLDTRSMRVKKTLNNRAMLGYGQWQALENWLMRVKDKYPVKFIVTSCALLFRMWADLPRDRWTGFPKERQRLLSFLANHEIEGVHLLAGDLHSGHAVRAELKAPGGCGLPLWEFCSSPFEQKKTNWLAPFTYLPLVGSPIKNQKLHFTSTDCNFGIVRVEFDDPESPTVRFELHSIGEEEPQVIET